MTHCLNVKHVTESSERVMGMRAPRNHLVKESSSRILAASLRWLVAALCGLGSLSSGQQLEAQVISAGWSPLGGPGGRISHLVVGASANELYAVSTGQINRKDDYAQWRDSGTPVRSDALYRSEDGGSNWQPAGNGLLPGRITALYVDPATKALFAGVQARGDSVSGREGLWRSTDRGATWDQVPLGIDHLAVQRIARSAGDRYLYVGAIAGASQESYVDRSSDDGDTWTQSQPLRSQQDPSPFLTDLLPHPQDPKRLFVVARGDRLYQSTDAGDTWNAASLTASSSANGSMRLAIRPDRPDTLLAVGGYSRQNAQVLRVQLSRDGGATWSLLSGTGLPENGEAQALVALAAGTYLLATGMGVYRSGDDGRSWQLLEGPLSSGDVTGFAVMASGANNNSSTVLAATGYGVFISQDGGALWQAAGSGLPLNSSIEALLTDQRLPGRVVAINNLTRIPELAPPLLLISGDNGITWKAAGHGMSGVATAWTADPSDPNTFFLASNEQLLRTTDGGLTWRTIPVGTGRHQSLAVAPSDPNTVYLGGQPAARSTDRGATWMDMSVTGSGQQTQNSEVTGLAVDPIAPEHLWASLDQGGIFESADGGKSWRSTGLQNRTVRWLIADWTDGNRLYAGMPQDGIYRWDGATSSWVAASSGLPAQSTVIAFLPDPRTPGTLWAARDGGGVYRSTDRGTTWTDVAAGMGDNLAQTLAIDYAHPGGLLMGTANAGVWALRAGASASERPEAVDARIEIVWPHDWAPVAKAQLANLGLRLFLPKSLVPPPCGWNPRVTIWQAVDTDPAQPLGTATQLSFDGRPVPYWQLNDVDVSLADSPDHKLYFMVRVGDTDTMTSVWAHGADPRTYYPQPEVPSGLAVGDISAVDARIQIVWPHDEAGALRPVTGAKLVNVAVALFKHGTRLSVPVGWQPQGIALYGAWNQEIGRPLSREVVVAVRQSGAITYPTWEFNNIPADRAMNPANELYMWVIVDGIQTYPMLWTHGADARTFFPAQDEPIQGCVP